MLAHKRRQRLHRRAQHPPRRLVVVGVGDPQYHAFAAQVYDEADHAVDERGRDDVIAVLMDAVARQLVRLTEQLAHRAAVPGGPARADHDVGARAQRAVDEVLRFGGGGAGEGGVQGGAGVEETVLGAGGWG